MTDRERMEIIEQLALVKNYHPAVFDNMSDEQILEELKRVYGD